MIVDEIYIIMKKKNVLFIEVCTYIISLLKKYNHKNNLVFIKNFFYLKIKFV